MALSLSLKKPVVFMMLGVPGAGKTHFSRQLSEFVGITHINADRIRFELFENPEYTEEEDGVVFRIMDYMTEELLRVGQSVVYDASNNKRKQRQDKFALANSFRATTLCVWVQTDLDTALDRSQSRDRRRLDDKYSENISDELFERLVGELQKPNTKENYVVISGKHVFRNQFNMIKHKLKDLRLLADPQTPIQGSASVDPQTKHSESRRLLGGRVDYSRRKI